MIKESLSYLDGKKVGIVTTAQHLHSINNVKKILIENDFIPILSEGDSRIYSEGQILGCNFSAGTMIMDEVDCYLFIGSGNFHPIGLILSVDKPVVAVDPYINEIKKQELIEFKDKILKQRISVIANLKDANVFGILLGIKKGQQRLDQSYKIMNMIKSSDKKAYFIAMDNFSSYPLENFRDIDCFVSTSCPRIAIDDIHIYKKSIITPIELEILLGMRDWDDYKFDQI